MEKSLMMIYKTSDVCCQEIHLDIENGIIKDVYFDRGCNGSLKGIVALVSGKKVDDVINQLNGITCGHRHTSCPDQLAKALKEAINSLPNLSI